MTNILSKIKTLSFVSICTITFNRRPFIKYLKESIKQQTYQGDIEWIIIDDGTDKIEDLIQDVDFVKVKYFKYDNKMSISKKRNLSNSLSKGDIIIYFDDDDYYPPERIEHAVTSLNNNPDYLIAGCNTMYIYFKDTKNMYSFGPYGKYHSTAASFAFKKELLTMTNFNDKDCLSEEKFFLKNYTIPLIQLNPLKTILVFRHIHNSFDKNELLNKNINSLSKLRTDIKINSFMKDKELIKFYTEDLDNLLLPYCQGEVSNKPDIVESIKKTNSLRKKILETQNHKNNDDNNDKIIYDKKYVDELKEHYENIIKNKNLLINNLLLKIKELK